MQNDQFVAKVIPFLKSEYFEGKPERQIFKVLEAYVHKYKSSPTKEILHVIFNNKDHITEDEYKDISELIDALNLETAPDDLAWLYEESERWCQERALHIAIHQSINIIGGQDKERTTGSIPELLSTALAVSFDQNIGHDYLDNAEQRYEFYHQVLQRVPFDLDMMNKITKGGLPKKTLNVIVGGVNVGKSLTMCHFAASYLAQHLNVLYITLEMSQESISERIDANLMGVDIDTIRDIPKESFMRRVEKMRNTIKGKLIVKEYPTASASVLHFKALMGELRLKKKFVPDVVIIDYINICTSSRIKQGSNVNSYSYIKAIAEELRGFAVEFNVPVITATQLTRTGFGDSDPDMTDVAESFGLPATADWMVTLIATDELTAVDQMMIKQVKSRYGDVNKNKKFTVGVDKAKMKLYDIQEKDQRPISGNGQDFTQNRPVGKPSALNNGGKPRLKDIKV